MILFTYQLNQMRTNLILYHSRKSMSALHHSPLGKMTDYHLAYDPSLLFSIPRQIKRDEIGIPNTLPFTGVDIWNAYELSWLTAKGKPVIAVAILTVPCTTPAIFESKSLKLYFNSFNQTAFDSTEDVQHTIEKDLSKATGGTVIVELILSAQFSKKKLQELPGVCIDNIDTEISCYQTDPSLLTTEKNIVTETLLSHLLKSNCLITNQPDWGSVMIEYTGPQINHENLLKYIVSFRQHNEFHEQCVERMFIDILKHCQPTELTIYARYTRRGGIDINPFRTNANKTAKNYRSYRQ